jgi:septal ring factor EnvC (AmiA/AmiB activator)
MEEGIKSRTILILAILTAIFFISSMNSCMDARRWKKDRDSEKSTRFDLEARAQKFDSEKAGLEDRIRKSEKSLEDVRAELNKTKEALLQEQAQNKNLAVELEKMTKLKEALEENLKEALVGKPPKKTK